MTGMWVGEPPKQPGYYWVRKLIHRRDRIPPEGAKLIEWHMARDGGYWYDGSSGTGHYKPEMNWLFWSEPVKRPWEEPVDVR